MALFSCNNEESIKKNSIEFVQTNASIKENNEVTLELTLDKPLKNIDTIYIQTINTTASYDDYSVNSEVQEVIKVPGVPNQTKLSFIIHATFDPQHEPTEYFQLKIIAVPNQSKIGDGNLLDCEITNDNLADGLVGQYLFSGNSLDTSPYDSNHGTVFGAVLTTDRNGATDSAYYFDGASYIEVPNHELLNFNNNFTLAVWINPSSFKTYGTRIIDKSVGSQGDGFLLDTYNQNLEGKRIRMMLGGNGWYFLSDTDLQIEEWHFVVVTYKDGIGKIYINGELNLVNTSNATSIIPSTTPMRFGFDTGVRTGPNYDDSFIGKLDNIRIYNRELSIDEIAILYGE